LLKRTPVLGGYDPSGYVTERRWVTARDNTRDRKLKLENLNCIYDTKKKRLRVYDGTWDDHLDNNGLEFIANTIVDRYLEAYEIYIIRKLYGGVVLSGAEANEIRACLKDYYKFIACFDIKPYAASKILLSTSGTGTRTSTGTDNNTDDFDEATRLEICNKLGDLYEQTNGDITKAYLKDVRKQMLDIIKANTHTNMTELDKGIIGIVNVQDDFKRLLFSDTAAA
jgi:hypothetical protein